MSTPRTIPLFDPFAKPPTWSERMAEGEYAVHFSEFETPEASSAPFCLLFSSLDEAVRFATAEILRRPSLRCRIYDHHGLGVPPVRELRGIDYRDRTDISPAFRRWGGGIMLVGGLALFFADWARGFAWLWPSMLGSRIMLPGAVLVFMEVCVVLYERKRRREEAALR